MSLLVSRLTKATVVTCLTTLTVPATVFAQTPTPQTDIAECRQWLDRIVLPKS
jgi:hypothetical protein